MTQAQMIWEEWNLLTLRIDDLKRIIQNPDFPPTAVQVKEWEELARERQAELTTLVERTKTCLRWIAHR